MDAVLDADFPRHGRLPFLVKLLAAGSPLSIQAHPSKSQAEMGYAREEAMGVPRTSETRNYRDSNHKPELIVALSDGFQALAGLRDVQTTRRFLSTIGEGALPLQSRLNSSTDSAIDAIRWALSGATRREIRSVIHAATYADSTEFAAELALVRRLDAAYPDDAGILVAMLMNFVTLARGEGLFVPQASSTPTWRGSASRSWRPVTTSSEAALPASTSMSKSSSQFWIPLHIDHTSFIRKQWGPP